MGKSPRRSGSNVKRNLARKRGNYIRHLKSMHRISPEELKLIKTLMNDPEEEIEREELRGKTGLGKRFNSALSLAEKKGIVRQMNVEGLPNTVIIDRQHPAYEEDFPNHMDRHKHTALKRIYQGRHGAYRH